MKIRKAVGTDIPELAKMHYDLLHNAYPTRMIAPIEYIYQAVTDWILKDEFIRVTYDTEITGFILVRPESAGGLTETILNAEITYVKPQYRNTKAAFTLMYAGFEFAKECNLGICSTNNSQSADIVEKRFGAVKSFTHFETPRDYITDINKQNNKD